VSVEQSALGRALRLIQGQISRRMFSLAHIEAETAIFAVCAFLFVRIPRARGLR
jgi:hypothetical protein